MGTTSGLWELSPAYCAAALPVRHLVAAPSTGLPASETQALQPRRLDPRQAIAGKRGDNCSRSDRESRGSCARPHTPPDPVEMPAADEGVGYSSGIGWP